MSRHGLVVVEQNDSLIVEDRRLGRACRANGGSFMTRVRCIECRGRRSA